MGTIGESWKETFSRDYVKSFFKDPVMVFALAVVIVVYASVGIPSLLPVDMVLVTILLILMINMKTRKDKAA